MHDEDTIMREKGYVSYLQDMFEIRKVNRRRVHQHRIVVKHSRSGLREFFRIVITTWNGLSEDTVSVKTPGFFKTRLDKHFIGKEKKYHSHIH